MKEFQWEVIQWGFILLLVILFAEDRAKSRKRLNEAELRLKNHWTYIDSLERRMKERVTTADLADYTLQQQKKHDEHIVHIERLYKWYDINRDRWLVMNDERLKIIGSLEGLSASDILHEKAIKKLQHDFTNHRHSKRYR